MSVLPRVPQVLPQSDPMRASLANRRSVVSFLLCAAPVLAQAQATTPKPADALLQAIASNAPDPMALTRDVWNGFAVPTQFLVCRASGETVVVGDAATRARLGAVPADPTRGGIGVLATPPGRLADVCFDLAFAVGTARLIAVPVIGALYSITDSLTANVVQLYHEAFHAFQTGAFAPTRGSPYAVLQEVRLPLALIRSPAFDSLARVERHLFAEAVRSTEADTVRARLVRALAVRDARMQLLPPSLRQAEAHHERKEGSAQWVGYTAAMRRLRRSRADVSALVARDLEHTPSFADGQPDDYFGNSYRQWHIYATGAALALLLERLGVAWQAEIQSGATFDALVRRHLGVTSDDAVDGALARVRAGAI